MINNLPTMDDFKKDKELFFDFLDFFFKFKPYDYQKNFLLKCLNCKRIAGKWCRQSGKSMTVSIYCLFKCLIEPTTFMISAPTQNQSSELYSKIRTLAESSFALQDELKKSTETELVFKNGSRIKALPTGPEGKTIRGFTADVVIMEEAQGIKDEIVNTVITPMLASKKDEGQLIKIGTPLVKNHFHRSCQLDPNFEVVNVDWKLAVEAGQYSQSFVDEQRKLLTDIEFMTEYGNEFVEENSMFFPSSLINSCLEDYNLIRVM